MTQADSARRRQKDFGFASKHTYSEMSHALRVAFNG